ncbi:Mss4-like protein [Aspergillus egyptiacus]|nr:Mss4-like protein [Aspergillus egyptiacus]
MVRCISCLCGKVTQQVQLHPSSNEGVLNICHCKACRRVTGQICVAYYLLQKDSDLETLEKYRESESIDRYFCGTCGSHVFAHLIHAGQSFVAAGLLDTPPQTKSVRHWGVSDSQDGGLSVFLPGHSADNGVSCWLAKDRAISGGIIESERPHQYPSELPARCHCGGVELYISQPDSTSEDPWSPWPDLIVPYCTGGATENEEDVKWWLCAEKTKYLAGICVCRTCRLASGFPIQSWAFIPKSNIRTTQHLPLMYGVGTMKRYESSSMVYREFCSRCGASVFWHCEKRPQLIDVSVGLLQAEGGSRAEEWLEWATGRASFAEMAVDKSLVQQLEAGLQARKAEAIKTG